MVRMTPAHRRARLDLLEARAPQARPSEGQTLGDLLDEIADPAERRGLAAAVEELVALDARWSTWSDADAERAASIARAVHCGLLAALPRHARR